MNGVGILYIFFTAGIIGIQFGGILGWVLMMGVAIEIIILDIYYDVYIDMITGQP